MTTDIPKDPFEELSEIAINNAHKLADCINEKAEEMFLGEQSSGVQGMTYQILASYILAHCIAFIQNENGPKEHIEILIDSLLKDAFRIAANKNHMKITKTH